MSGTVYTGTPTLSDPLSYLPIPSIPATSYGTVSITGSGSLTGSGVLIYNAAGAITMTGSGTLSLSASSSSVYQGLTIWQNRTSSSAVSITGSSTTNLVRTIYAASSTVSLTGSAGVSGTMGSEIVGRGRLAARAGARACPPPPAPLPAHPPDLTTPQPPPPAPAAAGAGFSARAKCPPGAPTRCPCSATVQLPAASRQWREARAPLAVAPRPAGGAIAASPSPRSWRRSSLVPCNSPVAGPFPLGDGWVDAVLKEERR